MSGFPISIGTSLALESIFRPQQAPYDPQRKIPQHINLRNYHTFWVNVTTLYRNMVGALNKDVYKTASAEEVCATLEGEIETINLLFQNEGQNVCKPEYYYGTYEDLKSEKAPGFGLREASTLSQKHYQGLCEATLKLLEKRTDALHRFKGPVRPARRDNALILTHQPYDLVEWGRFSSLELLESNTGVLKKRSLWNTKYNPMSGQSFSHLPFNRKLLLIFGDRYLIKPIIPLRKLVLDVAESSKWTPATTEEKVKFDFERAVRDPYAAAVFKAL